MEIAVVIHKDEGSVYGVTVPDVPGCYSSGETIDEAMENVREAIYMHVEYLLETGDQFNIEPSKIEDLTSNPDYQGGIWAFVNVDMAKLDPKPERVNISVPRFVLSKIDDFIKQRHETRSGFLARVATQAIKEESRKAERELVDA
ncbi:type II toxin-antitoxin system HicB family antitoxin [Undibacterium danionis]|uniref:Type II toxin-antitoxin system HicB family antitoxin n=1 Tax=Undibacterium danionis TaxID=1812100 RepID=A0ABV6IJM8_9BURK